MSNADTKIKEMLEVIEDICRYNDEVTMYEVMTLRDIGWTLNVFKIWMMVLRRRYCNEH